MTHEISERPVTIYEVAVAAGVSPSTVSRTFSRPGRVSVRTADHVRAVAADMGYRGDTLFRANPAERHRTIGLSVSDAANPFYFGILRGAETQAAKSDYTMLLIDAQESAARERHNLDRMLPLVDALIVASSRMSDTVLRSVAKSHPVVVLNRYVGGLPCVVPDTPHGMRQAVAHLLQLGHSSVHYLSGPDASWISGMRWLSVREAAAAMGFVAHRVGPVPPTIEGGASAAHQIIARRATAVICYNDLTAMGLIKALAAKGYNVPDDLSVIGCDNVFSSELLTPSLTTVAAPMGVLGDTAVRHVMAMLSGTKTHVTGPLTIPVKLMVRNSTGPRPVKHS
ncbi:MAG: LacI family transcriptional regulator [Propionibacteriaceae bacterium]|nr:LacI family transcriptional regulator [Propionibacteriaceae bacterium]